MSPIIKTLTADLYWSRNVGAALFAAARNSKCVYFFFIPIFLLHVETQSYETAVGAAAAACCGVWRVRTAMLRWWPGVDCVYQG